MVNREDGSYIACTNGHDITMANVCIDNNESEPSKCSC